MKNNNGLVLQRIAFILILCLNCSSATLKGQIITTIAGNGLPAFSGDGGPATGAEISYPVCCKMDTIGNLYFSDYNNSRIRKINGSGTISTIAGNGTYGFGGDGAEATSAAINHPTGLSIGTSGNLYISDYLNFRIRKVSPTGIITTLVGTGVSGYSGNGGPATAAQISQSWGIVEDATGNVLFSDRFNNVIRKINSSGTITTIIGTGVAGFSGDGGPASAAQLNSPVELFLDNSGNLYFSDFFNNRIRKISPSGIITTIAGNGITGYSGDGGAATNAELNQPVGLSMDSTGNIYIGDYNNSSIRKINSSGIISTIAGIGIAGYSGDGGPATAAEINTPQGVYVNKSGNIYICDAYNYRIRMINHGDNLPSFIGGHLQTLDLCLAETAISVPIDTYLSVSDIDAGQTETWSLLSPPSHGIAVTSYSAISTGGILSPIGLTYAPTSGYIGPDMFKVSVSDGFSTDTTTINVLISSLPNPGTISGRDTICPGNSDTLTESISGGNWISCNTSIITINSLGMANAISQGNDTIFYSVTNFCGTDSASFPIYVQSYSECHTGIAQHSENKIDGIRIFPNPNNGNCSVSVESDLNEKVQLRIYDLTGIKIEEFDILSNQRNEVRLNAIPGIYFISAITNEKTYNSRIVIWNNN